VAQPSLNLLSGSAMLECLDVGAASTLGGLHNMSVGEDHELWAPDGGSATLFGAAQTCESKQVSDGVISAHDFAVIMWAQFRVAPYDTLPHLPSEVPTVRGREKTNGRCGAGLSQQQYQLQLAEAETFCIAGTPEANATRRRLGDAAGDSEGGSQVLVESASTRPLAARVTRWSSVAGVGEWSRIELLEEGQQEGQLSDVPFQVLSLELFLVGVGAARTRDVSFEAPPAANCSAASCAPSHSPDTVTVGFHRRLDLLDGRDPSTCAYIQRAAADALRMGTLAIMQTPPSQACPFDLYVWVPEKDRMELGSQGLCAGGMGVDIGSNALDGRGGATQRTLRCAMPLQPPSPPPLPPSPLAPATPLPLPLPPPPAPPSSSDGPTASLLPAVVGVSVAAACCCLSLLVALRCFVARHGRISTTKVVHVSKTAAQRRATARRASSGSWDKEAGPPALMASAVVGHSSRTSGDTALGPRPACGPPSYERATSNGSGGASSRPELVSPAAIALDMAPRLSRRGSSNVSGVALALGEVSFDLGESPSSTPRRRLSAAI